LFLQLWEKFLQLQLEVVVVPEVLETVLVLLRAGQAEAVVVVDFLMVLSQ
jgi:hypothetical protein